MSGIKPFQYVYTSAVTQNNIKALNEFYYEYGTIFS